VSSGEIEVNLISPEDSAVLHSNYLIPKFQGQSTYYAIPLHWEIENEKGFQIIDSIIIEVWRDYHGNNAHFTHAYYDSEATKDTLWIKFPYISHRGWEYLYQWQVKIYAPDTLGHCSERWSFTIYQDWEGEG